MFTSTAVRLLTITLATVFVGSAHASTFRFVALPDTQIYSENRFPGHGGGVSITDPQGTYRYFTDQTQWVADNFEALGIDFVVHLGDIVQNEGRTEQWVRGKAALDILDDADVPYGTVMGNHDVHNFSSGIPYYQTYVEYFGPEEFVGRSWYGGASPTGASSYQYLADDDHPVLFLNLALSAPLEELAWADAVLREHRDKLVVITMHAWMFDLFAFAARYGEPLGGLGNIAGDGAFPRIFDGAGKTAHEIYHEFIKSHPNVVMAQGGHFDADLYRTDGRNGADLPVLEIVSDYQGLRNGGDGYLRIYEFDFDTKEIRVETYSPTLDRYRTTFEHFVNSVFLIYAYRDEVADALGINEEQAFALLASLFQTDSVPGVDVVGQHPEYLADPAFYDQLFIDLFKGTVPPEVGVLSDWETLWTSYFAVDPGDPFNYGPSIRSPSFTIPTDFERYVDTTALTAKQRACVEGMGSHVGRTSGLLAKRSRQNERCLRDAGRGRLGTSLQACLEGRDGSVARAEDKSLQIEAARCSAADEAPRFGFTSAVDLNTATHAASLGLTTDILGTTPEVASASSAPDAFRCQTEVAIRTNALLESMLRAALKHATRGLETDHRNGADLATGMLGSITDDPDRIINRFRARLAARIDRHCHGAGVDVGAALPGRCRDADPTPDALVDCLETSARCRACQTVNDVHGAAVSCDFFDDGASINQSCS